EYDPNTGQFLSVDPVLSADQAQTLNGYSYSLNNPATFSDPSGLYLDDGTGHSMQREGPQRDNVGVPSGGTGTGGCYYTCNYGTSNADYSPGSGTRNDFPPAGPKDTNNAQVDIPKEFTQKDHGYTTVLGIKGWCIFGIDTGFACVHGKPAYKMVAE